MAQGRANNPAGSIAWVAGTSYGRGQFLPADIAYYGVEQVYETNAEERALGAPDHSKVYAIVGPLWSKEDVDGELNRLRENQTLNLRWSDTPLGGSKAT